MQTTTITVPERDQGEIVAVTLSGGQEYPNDATFYVSDERGRLLPFELPPRLFTLNNRPIARVDFDAPAVCGRTVSFSGDRTTDPEGDPLDFVWRFGDGTSEASRNATHTYAEEGRYVATMEVRDPGPQLGRGSAATVSLFLKEAPVALSDKRQLVGAGEETVFDGSPSTASKWQVATHAGTSATAPGRRGPGGRPRLRRAGRLHRHPYRHRRLRPPLQHRLGDLRGPGQCRAGRRGRRRPPDRHRRGDGARRLAPRPTATGRSSPSFGISATAPPATASSCAMPMPRPAPTPSASRSATTRPWRTAATTDSLTIIVNDPPVPEAGADKSVAIDQTITFDAAASRDNDGTDRRLRMGLRRRQHRKRAGRHPRLRDVRHLPGDAHRHRRFDHEDRRSQSDSLSVRVNEPPVAEAGADRRIAIAEETIFDAGASADADGTHRLLFLGLRRRRTPATGRGRAAPLRPHRGTYTVASPRSMTVRRSRTASTTTR